MSHGPASSGCIRIQPALNEAERDHLLELLDSPGTLRGTPTGRGDAKVPFARLAWEPCPDGCCLEWNAALEEARWMMATLRFVIDHLLRAGAKGERHPAFAGFTFDHVATGAVLARTYDQRTAHLVTVTANEVSGREVPAPCDVQPARPPATRAAHHHDNVIELRPRRA